MRLDRETILRNILLFYANRLKPVHPRKEPHYLALSASFSGSLGDEAMLAVTLSCLPEDHVTVLVWDEDDREAYEKTGKNVDNISPFATRPVGFRKNILTLAFEVRRIMKLLDSATHLIVTGADVLDGRYSEVRSLRRLLLADLAQARGLDVTICGFSFSDKATEATKTAFRKISPEIKLSIRDPKSAERLTNLLGRPMEANADLAFLLEPERPVCADFEEIEKALKKRRSKGGHVIGVNLNRQAFGPGADKNPEGLVEIYCDLIRYLNENLSCTFLLIPHDYRGKHSDEILLAKLKNEVFGHADIQMLPSRLSAANAKYLASISDIVITGRMHLAIASLGSCVPPLVQDYQGKVEGLLAHFGLSDLLVTSSEFQNTNILGDKIVENLKRKEELSEKIKSSLDRVKQSARNNIML